MIRSIEDFDFELPQRLIAGEPLEVRSASRMLAVDRSSRTFDDSRFEALPGFLRGGDVLVLNNTKVFPARLYGTSDTGAKVEIFLVERIGGKIWKALAKPARRLSPGKRIRFNEAVSGEILERTEDGSVVLRFELDGDLDAALDRVGRTPLPPYIKRERDAIDRDRERYQTVFARERGAIAAPTAGLHFTPEIIEAIRAKGVRVAEITLHVGYGTFEPVRAEVLSEHRVSPERYEVTGETAAILNDAKSEGRRIIAVGTTTTRTLEFNVGKHGRFAAAKELAELTILPGYEFKAIDGLVTNFHLPKSSLLVLVSTFAGHELIMDAYRHAVESRYRFYSYGDCMLIV